jgi:sulfate adenylyltransferase large subunit
MAAANATDIHIDEWLKATAETELLRLTTAGSVDDGKSTLIGRLLYDSKGVYEDQLTSIRKATRNQSVNGLDLSLLTDGLRAEREQGITIDVAYRYFSTPKRKFIIADTPGHEQYTRNMATGASTANLAIILIDARFGVLPQSRRHAFIASLLGIPHIVVAVNKMDMVDFREEVFTSIRDEFEGIARQLELRDAQFIPLSALHGDNVVRRSERTPWYRGPSLLEHLETMPVSTDRNLSDFRFPVQYVVRPDLHFRGFAGQLASGVVRRGDAVTVLPSGRASRVKSIVTYDGELAEAFAPMSVTLCLEDEVDVSRGDLLADPADPPEVGRHLEVRLVWMNEKPLVPNRTYLLKHTAQTVQARVREIRHRVDIHTFTPREANELALNEIGLVTIETQRPLFFDPYRRNRATGSLILIDTLTNETVAAGMIVAATAPSGVHTPVTRTERSNRYGHPPAVLNVPDAATARAAERYLFDHGALAHVLEGPASPAVLREFAAAGQILIVAGPESIVIGDTGLDVPVVRAEDMNAVRAIWTRLSETASAGPAIEYNI